MPGKSIYRRQERQKKIRNGIYVIEWEKPAFRTETSESYNCVTPNNSFHLSLSLFPFCYNRMRWCHIVIPALIFFDITDMNN